MSHPDPTQEQKCDKKNYEGHVCTEDEPCEWCCEHQDVEWDERCCLICGKNMTEEMVARAEALYDASRGH